LADLSDTDLAAISVHLTGAVHEVLTVAGSISSRSGFGGTAPERVDEQTKRLRSLIDEQRAWATPATPRA
jgi:argininosuccinate lyase